MSDKGTVVDPPASSGAAAASDEPGAPVSPDQQQHQHQPAQPPPARTHSSSSFSSSSVPSLSRHRNSSGGESSSQGSGSSVSCGGVRSLTARSTWSIEEEDGDDEDGDSDGDDSAYHGGRSRDTSSASLSAFLPSRMTFHLPLAADLDDPHVHAHGHHGSHRASAASTSASTTSKAARASTSSVTASHSGSAAPSAHDHHHHHHHHHQAGQAGRRPPQHQHHAPPRKKTLVSPALAHFRAKVQAAVRTALAAGMTAAISQFVWLWGNYTWFSITLCISGTRQTLGETLTAAYDFWHGAALILPLVYLVHTVRGHTVLVAAGLFFATVLVIAYPGVSDAGKRMATILLSLVILAGERDPDLAYHEVLGDLLLALLMSNIFSVAALLLPLPTAALALLDARRQLKTLRHRLGSLLRGFDIAFGLGEEVHHSVLEQLLEEAAQALSAIKALLPYLRYEMMLLRLPRRAHAHLIAYLAVVERQLDLLRGLKLSLRRMPHTGTHREFLAYIHRPLGSVLLACVAVADTAGRQIENELLVFPWLRERRLQQRQQQRQRHRTATHHQGPSPRRQTTATHHRQRQRAVTAANPGDDLDALVTIAEARLEVLMAEFLKARLAVFFGFKVEAVTNPEEAAVGVGSVFSHSSGVSGLLSASARHAALQTLMSQPEEEEEEEQEGADAAVSTPSTSDPSVFDGSVASPIAAAAATTAEGHVCMATGAGGGDAPPQAATTAATAALGPLHPFGKGGEAAEVLLTLTKRRMSGEAVYTTFQQEYAKLGTGNVMPRNAFLMDVDLYVRSLEDLVAACFSSTDAASSARPEPLSWPSKAKAAVVAPAVAVWQWMPWQKAPRTASAESSTSTSAAGAGERGRSATAATAATTLSGGQTQATVSSGGGGGGRAMERHAAVSATTNHPTTSTKTSPVGADTAAAKAAPGSGWGQRLLRRLRQPLKVALAVVIASLGILLRRGPATTWAAVAVCQSLTSHPGSSFRSAWNRIQGTVLGGMAGIAALEWCGLTSPPAIVVFITVWTLFCCFSRRSAAYGECAVVAALTAPIIMLGPVAGEQGAMLRVEQTVLGCLIYSFIDNLFYPVRAKLDLRRELVASLDAFRELWTSAFGVFLEEEGGNGGGGGGEEGRAKAQASHARLMESFSSQERFISLAQDEPELWHKPFHAVAYRKVVGTLTQASLFLSMLMRASAAFPRELSPRDRAMHAAIQSAVAELAHATGQALEQARNAVLGMTQRHAASHPHVTQRTKGGDGGGGGAAHLPVAPAGGGSGGSGKGNYHRRKKTQAVVAPRPMSPTTAQAYALLGLAEQYARLKDFIDLFWAEHIQTKRAQEDTGLVSAEFILAISGMIFSLECLGGALLKVGHALRELVEREKINAYAL